jgi:hypothetical protein
MKDEKNVCHRVIAKISRMTLKYSMNQTGCSCEAKVSTVLASQLVIVRKVRQPTEMRTIRVLMSMKKALNEISTSIEHGTSTCSTVFHPSRSSTRWKSKRESVSPRHAEP